MAKRIRVGAKRARVPSRARRTAQKTKPAEAPVKKKRGPKKGATLPYSVICTPEVIAECRRRYEQTPEPLASIGLAFGLSYAMVWRLGRDNDWVRFKPAPVALPEAARLEAEVEALEKQFDAQQGDSAAGTATPAAGEAPGNPLPGAIESALKTTEALLAKLKAQQQRAAHAPAEGNGDARAASTLSSLTNTLARLQRMRAGAAPSGDGYFYDDEMPADIDAFRDELARQIEVFLESREGEEDAEPHSGGDGEAPAA